ncbi:MAG: GIY-YIG nuclease family protein [Alteromonadaceae bacterium]|nr:GIY-YIG nuclease family protein [Alteromonadaceae bacterium]
MIPSNEPEKDFWYVYLLRVSNGGALYCGITNCIERRLNKHAAGTGAKFLRGKSFTLAWFMYSGDKSSAARLEAKIKKLSKQQKEALVEHAPAPLV